jgi:hypothetical protein
MLRSHIFYLLALLSVFLRILFFQLGKVEQLPSYTRV